MFRRRDIKSSARRTAGRGRATVGKSRNWRDVAVAAPRARRRHSLYIEVRNDACEIVREARPGIIAGSRPVTRRGGALLPIRYGRPAHQWEEVRLRETIGGYSRWNWMAPAIARMERFAPRHGKWARRHYAEVLHRARRTTKKSGFRVGCCRPAFVICRLSGLLADAISRE